MQVLSTINAELQCPRFMADIESNNFDAALDALPTQMRGKPSARTAETFYSRVFYPSFLDSHFHLAVFVTLSKARATGRLMTSDPYSKYSHTVSSWHQNWLEHVSSDISIRFLHDRGGSSASEGRASNRCQAVSFPPQKASFFRRVELVPPPLSKSVMVSAFRAFIQPPPPR